MLIRRTYATLTLHYYKHEDKHDRRSDRRWR